MKVMMLLLLQVIPPPELTPLDIFRSIVESSVPIITAITTILVAMFNSGLVKQVKGENKEDKPPPKDVAEAASSASAPNVTSFNVGMLHHVAGQERRIGDLETLLMDSRAENAELREKNSLLEKEVTALTEWKEQHNKRLDIQEERLTALEVEQKSIKDAKESEYHNGLYSD